MYEDPTQIRDIIRTVRFNEREDDLVQAIVNYTGQQMSTLIRELALEQIRLVLAGQGDLDVTAASVEAPQKQLNFTR